MFIEFLITFRETFEAALIIGIIFSYLRKIDQFEKRKYVFMGTFLGILFSILGAIIFQSILGGFEGQVEEVFEGFMMIIGATMITTMVVWLHRQSKSFKYIETTINRSLDKSQSYGIFFLAFISVLREGIETVIFLSASTLSQESFSLFGSIAGIVVAIFVGMLVYKGIISINLRAFFNITSLFLIIVAAGLLSYGIHELQEANIIPTIIEHIYDINPLIYEKGALGSLLNAIFGYNGNPSLIETLAYLIYLAITLFTYFGVPSIKNAKEISKSLNCLDQDETVDKNNILA
ncbi:FTR1 family protein [Candidatus Lokiarchaeum ossiferum]|uniref:FTR1 family protein n=1 Tax=Candidatus Lokiarchaeum ossiferum TaxID=2951803 RepID=UPI00352D0F6A